LTFLKSYFAEKTDLILLFFLQIHNQRVTGHNYFENAPTTIRMTKKRQKNQKQVDSFSANSKVSAFIRQKLMNQIFLPSQENFKGTNKSHQCDTT